MNILTFDTETTGLVKHPSVPLSEQPRMIEFGGLLTNENGKILEEINIIVNPEVKIEPIITKITGLEQSDLDDKPLFIDVYAEIAGLFKRADLMVAHNLPFDYSIICFELERMGAINFPWPYHRLCTVKENEPRYGYRPKLTELYEDVTGKPLDQTHRALDDCRALYEIVHRMKYHDLFSSP